MLSVEPVTRVSASVNVAQEQNADSTTCETYRNPRRYLFQEAIGGAYLSIHDDAQGSGGGRTAVPHHCLMRARGDTSHAIWTRHYLLPYEVKHKIANRLVLS